MAARHRFYLLIAGLASCAMMNKSHGKDIGYTIGEVLYFNPYCASPASGDGDTPCQVCVPSRIAYDKCNYSTSCIDNWINDENICLDNTCSSYNGTSNIHYGGAYGKNSGGGFYICGRGHSEGCRAFSLRQSDSLRGIGRGFGFLFQYRWSIRSVIYPCCFASG